MNEGCRQLDRILDRGPEQSEEESERRREHLAGCAACREQAAADVLLSASLAAAVPELVDGFESRLRRCLERRVGKRREAAPAQGRSGASGWWALAAYGTAATAASVVVLARLPWASLTLPPAFAITLGAVALLSPLVLLDRIGLVRPPG